MTEQEMLKEALEWQEHIRKLITATDDELYHKRSKVFDWLIKQAERAQKNAQDLEDMDRQLFSEQQQNQRYKQALEFYADEDNYCVSFEDDYEPILKDNGKIAREALEWNLND